jgi:hypothetical protein
MLLLEYNVFFFFDLDQTKPYRTRSVIGSFPTTSCQGDHDELYRKLAHEVQYTLVSYPTSRSVLWLRHCQKTLIL